MPYVAINERRIPYDIDGTEIGLRLNEAIPMDAVFGNGVLTWLSSADKGDLNKENRAKSWLVASSTGSARGSSFFFFFPELREVTKIGLLFDINAAPHEKNTIQIQGSIDSTNGMDGTWESAVITPPTIGPDKDFWRKNIFTVSFSSPVKVLRFGIGNLSSSGTSAYPPAINLNAIHIYGRKAAGQNPDDIVFTDASGDILTSLVDFGDVPEGTTSYEQIRVKNASATKNANDINLQFNHDDFDFSYSPTGPWVSVIDISSLGPGSLSSIIYVRNHLNPPLLALGPKAARIIASVGSWT